MEFDDSSTVQDDIEEEIEFGTLEFRHIRARVTTLIDVKTGQRDGDNFRKITFFDTGKKIRAGQRFRFDNKIWLVFATKNLKTITSSCYVQKCNHTLNTQDIYGNIHREPVYIDYKLNETQLSKNEFIDVPSGRLNLSCQVNQWTAWLDVNKRFIIGPDVYKIRYRAKYERDDTFDPDSVTLAQYYLAYDNKAVNDNFELGIADYVVNNFAINTDAKISNVQGFSSQIIAKVTMNGETVDEPLVFTSNNKEIATIDEQGNYTLVADGQTEFIVQMKNKPDCVYVIDVNVGEVVDNIAVIPDIHKIRLNESVNYEITSDVQATISVKDGPPSYYYEFVIDGNKFSVRNIKQSSVPLVIEYAVGDVTGEFEIILGGLL